LVDDGTLPSVLTEAAARGVSPPVDRTSKYRARQDAIVCSAVDVINRKGVRGMTLADIACTLGLVPTGIIYYFASKEDLAAACFLKALETYDSLIDEASDGPTPEARLAKFVRGFFRHFRDVAIGAADNVAVFNDVRALANPVVNTAYTAMFRRARGLLTTPRDERADRPAANARTHHVLSQLFWAVAWLPRYDPDDYERAGERMLDILTHGIRGPGRIWAPVTLSMPELKASAEVSRETFLRAATDLMNEQGYHGASVEKISARLKVTKGSFYHHNDAKDDLVVACFERTVEVMRATQRRAETAASSGWDRLCATSAALVEYQIRGGAPFLRTSALTSVPEEIRLRTITKFDRVSDYFSAVMSDGIADGSIRPIDANVCAQMITGVLNAAAELGFWTAGLEPDTLTHAFLQPLFEGISELAPTPARP
jgi:AcrR family transcriptional regulator